MLRPPRAPYVHHMQTLIATYPRALERNVSPGEYLTDGIRLFRVVATPFDPWKGECAELEDCYTLATRTYPPDAFSLLRLEPISLQSA